MNGLDVQVLFSSYRENGRHRGEYEAIMHSVIEFLTAKGYSLALKKYTGSRQGYAGGNRRKRIPDQMA